MRRTLDLGENKTQYHGALKCTRCNSLALSDAQCCQSRGNWLWSESHAVLTSDWVKQGTKLASFQKNREAIKYYDKALRTNPNDDRAGYYKAWRL